MIYLNGDPVNVTLFPDNTSQVWKLDEKYFGSLSVTIEWDFTHEGEFMQLAQLKHLLDYYGVERVYLNIHYLPYGRQDKWIANNATFALRSFAYMLNNLHFTEILILDPHSQVATDIINRSMAYYPHNSLQKAIKATGADLICYPDNGAWVKYADIYDTPPYIYGRKVRDQETGFITNYELVGKCEDKIVLIVDDICDGGKTFEILAKDLFAGGAENVHLFVTHGLFSKGLRPLKRAGINMIFTNKGRAVEMPDGGLGFRKDWMNDPLS